MKKITVMILVFLFSLSLVNVNVYALQTQMYVGSIEYLNTRTDNALVPVKLNQLPVTTTNGNGTYGVGLIKVNFNKTELKYVGVKTGSMVSSKGAKSIYWSIGTIPSVANVDGVITIEFIDSTIDSSKSYGEGSFEIPTKDTLVYLEFEILDKTVGKEITITLVDGQFSGNVIISGTEGTAISMPSLMVSNGNMEMESGDITIITSTPEPTTTPSSTGGGGNGGSLAPISTVKPEHSPYIKGYIDGTFRTESNITRAETATIISRLSDGFEENTDYGCKFTDVNADLWSANYIGFSQNKGVIVGYPDGKFKPEDTITRAEFATMISRFKMLKAESNKTLPFSDVNSHWSINYLSAVYEKGYILGYPDGTFAPDQPITRAEAVTIINRAIDRVPDKTNVKIDSYLNPFSDVAKGYWAYYDVLESASKHFVEDFH